MTLPGGVAGVRAARRVIWGGREPVIPLTGRARCVDDRAIDAARSQTRLGIDLDATEAGRDRELGILSRDWPLVLRLAAHFQSDWERTNILPGRPVAQFVRFRRPRPLPAGFAAE